MSHDHDNAGRPVPSESDDRLIASYLDGSMTDAQYDALCVLLTAKPELLHRVAELSQLDQMLCQVLSHDDRVELVRVDTGSADESEADSADAGSVLAQLAALEAEAGPVELVDQTDEFARRGQAQKKRLLFARRDAERRRAHTSHGPARPFVFHPALVWISVAALVGLVVWLGWFATGQSSSLPGGEGLVKENNLGAVYATVVRKLDARWRDGAESWEGGVGLREGRHDLSEGLVEIEFAGGARVVLEAPVTFELTGTDELLLTRGRLVAHVPSAAIGFVVNTSSAQIADHGTEFGVDVGRSFSRSQLTQVHVIRGEVHAVARVDGQVVGEPVVLQSQQAAVMDRAKGTVERIAFDAQRFESRVVKRLDLVDMVAGGDGTGHARSIGIDPTSGRHLTGLPDTPEAYARQGDGRFYSTDRAAFIAGVFVPGAAPSELRLPGGVTLPALPVTGGKAYGLVWCGGVIPADRTGTMPSIPAVIEGIDYAQRGHGVISLHANVGLVIDLDAIRAAYPGFEIARVTAVIDNSLPSSLLPAGAQFRSEFRVFLDSDIALHRMIEVTPLQRTPAIDLDLEPSDAPRYLTFVATDGGDSNGLDWIVIGDPVIELRPIERHD